MAKTKKTNTKKKGIAEELQLIEKGIKSLTTSEKWEAFLKFHSSFHNYSFRNVMLIYMQCQDASRVTGYRTWQKLGRQVIKGEKAIKILAPYTFNVEVEKENDKGVKETKEEKRLAFRTVPVFDVSQTEGEELPTVVNRLTGETELYQKALEKINVPVTEEEIESGANGYYHLVDKRIAIKKDLEEVHKLKTLIHEWGHSILHDRDITKDQDQDDKVSQSVMELEAESTAFIVCHRLGIDTSDYSFGYLAGWGSGENAVELIKQSGERIQKASSEILDALLDEVEIKKEQEQKTA
jgi:antirestriction protein ArdC